MSINTDGWICPQNPIGHEWAEGKQRCFLCGHTRPATEAVLSLLSGSRACSEVSARMLLDALVAEAVPPVPQTVAAARGRLHAMFNLSAADETELDARVDAVIAAETTALRARIDELEAAVGTARAMHRRHSDSEHCQYDDMPWPCPTMIALSDQPAPPEDEPLRCTCARSWNLHSRDCALYAPGRERINARLAADAEATHWKRLGINPPEPTL